MENQQLSISLGVQCPFLLQPSEKLGMAIELVLEKLILSFASS
ncbi:hypothetical protein MADA3029_470036 [Vibrio nigripulchritudo MADA3029]|nr:hypothetical protein [Vibrio nigripulchritudo]CCN59764.1 hypothetical protein MADA3029_470036 [Vibrio nigripulchritudo MADA3029]CCN68839.1 hypothetical protein VIBNISFn118_1110067 [Vibrio nigripulchritudo SFn118]